MSAVRDPNFWKRFSVAVHQDDAVKVDMAKRPDLKHSYVSSPSCTTTPSPVVTPTSQSHLEPAFQSTQPQPQPLSPVALQPFSPSGPYAMSQPSTPTSVRIAPPKRQPSKLQKAPSIKTKSRPSTAPDLPSPPLKSPRTPRRPSFAFTRHTNGSQMTLGLSGRPQSRFKFWTSVTADPSNRDSWLESQRRKKKQRTWMCWVFWLCFAVLVAGIVVAILLLKAKKII